MTEKKPFNIFPYIFIFLAVFIGLQFIMESPTEDPILEGSDIGITTVKNDYAIGKDIKVEIQNNTPEAIEIEDKCPEPYFEVYKYTSDGFIKVSSDVERVCDKETDSIIVESGDKTTISLLDFSYSYFGEVGRYKLAYSTAYETTVETALAETNADETNTDEAETEESISTTTQTETFWSPEFEITEPGFITKAWRSFIYRPIYNALIAILVYTPGHYLWLAIMALTLFLRTILLIPSQKAMRAQRAMQEVQPKIDALKEKYGDDQAKIAQETMLLWKEHKVSPVSSCLPTLIQLPILIALFYTIKWGLSPDKSVIIYSFMPEFHLANINSQFLMFDLMDRSIIIFPLVIGGLQFLQMQLMMAKKKKNKKDKKKNSGMAAEMENATSMMKYIMPIMIAFFTAQLPAAVGLYWGTSTFYGIIQQLVVNKGGSPSPTKPKGDEVKVRVINKKHGKKD